MLSPSMAQRMEPPASTTCRGQGFEGRGFRGRVSRVGVSGAGFRGQGFRGQGGQDLPEREWGGGGDQHAPLPRRLEERAHLPSRRKFLFSRSAKVNSHTNPSTHPLSRLI